jgi:sec-independent protein translocase protein TatA
MAGGVLFLMAPQIFNERVIGVNMFGRLGPTELIIILVIVLVLFGVGRISKIAGELGSGIRAFKDGLQPEDAEKEMTEDKPAPEVKE